MDHKNKFSEEPPNYIIPINCRFAFRNAIILLLTQQVSLAVLIFDFDQANVHAIIIIRYAYIHTVYTDFTFRVIYIVDSGRCPLPIGIQRLARSAST